MTWNGHRSENYVCEFIGTFFLVSTVGLNVLQKTELAPVAIGLVLMVLVYAVGNVSGGHLNPAVTLGVFVGDRLSGKASYDVVSKSLYVVAQLLGGLCGGFMCCFVLPATNWQSVAELYPAVGYTWLGAGVAELLGTFALVFVVLCVSRRGDNQYGGLVIGLTVMAFAFAIGGISGCSLNPAVTVGVLFPHLVLSGLDSRFGLYTLFPLFGGLLAGVVSHVLYKEETSKLPAEHTALEHRRKMSKQPLFRGSQAQDYGTLSSLGPETPPDQTIIKLVPAAVSSSSDTVMTDSIEPATEAAELAQSSGGVPGQSVVIFPSASSSEGSGVTRPGEAGGVALAETHTEMDTDVSHVISTRHVLPPLE